LGAPAPVAQPANRSAANSPDIRSINISLRRRSCVAAPASIAARGSSVEVHRRSVAPPSAASLQQARSHADSASFSCAQSILRQSVVSGSTILDLAIAARDGGTSSSGFVVVASGSRTAVVPVRSPV
jgi:hypothetical protein